MKLKTKILGSILGTITVLATAVPLASCSNKNNNNFDTNIKNINNLSATGYCKVSFSAGNTGAILTGTKVQQVKKNKMFGSVKQPVATLPSRKFLYWTDNNTNKNYTSSTTITSDVTLTPVFEEEKVSYTLKFANGLPDKTETVTLPSTITLPTPTFEGHAFQYWLDSDGNQCQAGTVINLTKDITFTAIWSQITIYYTVTFDSNYETGSSSTIRVESGKTISKPFDPQRQNYLFNGWYKETECNTPWDFSTDVVKANTTLYAKWTLNQKYNIVLSAGEGIFKNNKKMIRIDEIEPNTTIQSALESAGYSNPTREKYDFENWVDENGNVISSDTKINDNLLLTATWKISQVNVTITTPKGSTYTTKTDAFKEYIYTFSDSSFLDPPSEISSCSVSAAGRSLTRGTEYTVKSRSWTEEPGGWGDPKYCYSFTVTIPATYVSEYILIRLSY